MSTAFVNVATLATVPAVDTRKMSVKLAHEFTGGLSNPSKMPGYAWGIPAWECKVGSKLAKISGSTCSKCYARKRAYTWPSVRQAYQRRFERMSNPRWIEAMIFLIARTGDKYFRWMDSGDLQSVQQLRDIIAVCVALPRVKFWMPTREYRIVELFLAAGGIIPANLNIRLSAHMIDNFNRPVGFGLPTSTVHSSEANEPQGTICKAYTRGNKCGNCRACWDRNVANVSYLSH